MRVLLDVDGVLGDFVGHVLSNLAQTFVDAPKPEQMGSRHMFDYLTKKQKKHCEAFLQEAGTAYTMPEYPEAQSLVRRLREHHEVKFVTSPWDSPTWAWDRVRWLREYFHAGPKDVVLTPAKYLVKGDVLIEDYPNNAVEWRAEWRAGVALLVRRPWNESHPMTKFDLMDMVGAQCWGPESGIEDVREFVRARRWTGG